MIGEVSVRHLSIGSLSRRGAALALLVLGLSGVGATSLAAGRTVYLLPTTGIVDGGMAQYLADGVARAEREGAAAVVIKLNTPGGSLQATNDIVGTLLEAKVPVIVWVAPAGGFAASAGTFITPCAVTVPLASRSASNGEWHHPYGISVPKYSSSLFRYSLHAMPTVAAPIAYSSTRSQPMIQAMSSPIVAYE